MVLAIKRGTIRPWATTGNIYGWASLCTLGVSHHVPVFVAMVIAVDFAPSLFPYIPQQYIAFFSFTLRTCAEFALHALQLTSYFNILSPLSKSHDNVSAAAVILCNVSA